MQSRQHSDALTWQMFFDAGTETEMRALGIDQRRAELTIAEMLPAPGRVPRSWRHRQD